MKCDKTYASHIGDRCSNCRKSKGYTNEITNAATFAGTDIIMFPAPLQAVGTYADIDAWKSGSKSNTRTHTRTEGPLICFTFSVAAQKKGDKLCEQNCLRSEQMRRSNSQIVFLHQKLLYTSLLAHPGILHIHLKQQGCLFAACLRCTQCTSYAWT